jgi:hypothetical protein
MATDLAGVILPEDFGSMKTRDLQILELNPAKNTEREIIHESLGHNSGEINTHTRYWEGFYPSCELQ